MDGTGVRTLVVDDHRSYAEALSMALERSDAIESLGCAFTVDEAIARVDAHQPDVVVLDWQLPGVDGIEGIGRVRTARPATAIVVLSGHASAIGPLARSAGAAAVLPKESTIADIATAVVRCAGGESLESTERPTDDLVALTPRETEVLWMLAKGKDAPRIAAELFLSVNTVRGYVKDLRQKFSAHSQLELVARARQRGVLP